jgi:O-antigen/teichoic acid export membrane protein
MKSSDATRAVRRSVLTYTAPFLVWGVPGYVLTFGDRLLLAYYSTVTAVGVYAAMVAATMSVGNAANAAISRVLEPEIFAIAGSGEDASRKQRAHRAVTRTIRLLSIAAVPVVVIYVLFPTEIIKIVSSGQYTGHAEQLWLMAVASALFLVGQVSVFHGLIEKRPWAYLPAKFAHAIILLATMLLLVPKHGVNGVVVAVLISQVAQLALVLGTNRYLVLREVA